MENEPLKQLSDKVPSSISQEMLDGFKKTYETIDRPEKFAKMFCEVSDSQSAVKEKLAQILILAIQHDVSTRQEMKKVLKEIYDEDWKHFIKGAWGKFALLVWTLFTAWLTHTFWP